MLRSDFNPKLSNKLNPSGDKDTSAGLSLLARFVVLLIRGYQIFLSPLLGKNCRFYPTCSQYAIIVFQEWGFLKGTWLTLCRLAKCGPWHEGGYDPPPRRDTELNIHVRVCDTDKKRYRDLN